MCEENLVNRRRRHGDGNRDEGGKAILSPRREGAKVQVREAEQNPFEKIKRR